MKSPRIDLSCWKIWARKVGEMLHHHGSLLFVFLSFSHVSNIWYIGRDLEPCLHDFQQEKSSGKSPPTVVYLTCGLRIPPDKDARAQIQPFCRRGRRGLPEGLAVHVSMTRLAWFISAPSIQRYLLPVREQACQTLNPPCCMPALSIAAYMRQQRLKPFLCI